MDSPSTTANSIPTFSPDSNPGSNDENPRVKFLCSFMGSIMPRPQDGKLRYVGGETRIVCVPRDITYEELMSKMRELYEDAAVLKYQQPDEDLDALVSVVNNDDVTNMMEEYDKLGSGDGFTRLRIFLFSHPEYDSSSVFIEGDEMDTERRYVEALNNLNDLDDFMRSQQMEASVMSHIDDIHGADQFFNPINSVILQNRSCEGLPQYNLRHLTIPCVGSGQPQQSVSQRYNEMEAPWSPTYYSPRHHGAEYPSSPSSLRSRKPFTDLPEEYARQQVNHQATFERQPQYGENVFWLPNGAITSEKSGFPGNILHRHNVIEGNSICEHCRMGFHRNQPHSEHTSMMNGIPQVSNPCAECAPNNRESLLNHQLNVETRSHVSGVGLNDHFIIDGSSGMNFRSGQGNLPDGYNSSTNLHQQVGSESGNGIFQEQGVPVLPHMHIPSHEERGVVYGHDHIPYAYGGDSHYHSVSHGHVPGTAASWRNIQNPMHVAPYEASNSHQQVNGMANLGIVWGTREGSPRFCLGLDNQNPWMESSHKIMGFEGTNVPEHSYGNSHSPDSINFVMPEPVKTSDSSSILVHGKLVSLTPRGQNLQMGNDTDATKAIRLEGKQLLAEEKEASLVEKVLGSNVQSVSSSQQNQVADSTSEVAPLESLNTNLLNSQAENGNILKRDEESKLSVNRLSFLPELIASVKRAALEECEEVKAMVEEPNGVELNSIAKEESASNDVVSPKEPDLEIDNDHPETSKIEPTKAEAEAIARGLQTIKNDDLEEIRELGSGTYGAVYHGKWKGSDVAIKRIKASCFAGRPSERERLIADFWKEALILSSLHHPNVVSFYGIVRDGPDGSLATVTEFMVNGSLKQFLRKKDRTIDRRKRLIIAMDAAFGMEYLHGKNIVHFDLKCENLLVNMRDPQRPVCKIGDLGLSKVRQHTLVSGGVRGTLPWMAPELLSGKSNMVTEKIDVYSFGIVLWELLTGDEPYADMHCASIIGGIVNNTLRPQTPTWCDPEWKALMESCWDSDPSKRPLFSEISQKLRNMAAAINVK